MSVGIFQIFCVKGQGGKYGSVVKVSLKNYTAWKKRLKTCLILKKFSWEKHHWDAGIIGNCFNFPNLRRTDSSSNQIFCENCLMQKDEQETEKNQANSQWCAKLFSVAVVRLCPIVNWVWNKNPIYFKLMASFFSAPLRFFNSSHTHISSFEITFLERRNILFIGEPEISLSFPTSLPAKL